MKEVLRLTDDVDGISVMDDGTRCYWTEGPGGDVHVLHADGRWEVVEIGIIHPITAALEEGDNNGTPNGRHMNRLERHEYYVMRNMGREVADTQREIE